MRTHPSAGVFLALSLGLLSRARPAFAYPDKLQPFDQAIREAYLEILHSGKTLKHQPPEKKPPRKKDIVKTSQRVFKAAPDAAQELAHLRDFVDRQAAAESAEEGQDSPPRDLLSSDDPGLAALIGISVFWHEAQHHYDRALPYREGLSRLGMELPMPVEMEKRGWEAGCRFWKAGIGVLVKPTEGDWPQSYYCEDKFPAVYYCRLYFSVEIVVLTASQLKTLGRTRAQVAGAVKTSAGSPFERVFGAYCGEFERAQKGNRLEVGAPDMVWGPEECLERALAVVQDPAWKSSADLCAAPHPPGADIRATAAELRDWK